MPGIFMASLGCVKNTVDAEMMLGETLDDEIYLELDPERADVIIVNTCGFIQEARDEAEAVIGEYLDLKHRSEREVKVVATGCLAERYPDRLLDKFPSLDAVWGLATPLSLKARILSLRGPGTASGIGKPDTVREGTRLVTTLPSFAYLKISDGCDNNCRYCAIPLIRGGLRSRRPESVLREAEELADQGIKELVVIGQDITAYGMDIPDAGYGLERLLNELLTRIAVPRIRLLYAHPAHLNAGVANLLLAEPRLCRYLDLPLQHVSSPILAQMGRGYGEDRVQELLDLFSRPDFTLRTTFMTGFPGESEDDFRKMLDLVEKGRFRHLGAFAYSPEEGTEAAGFDNPVPPEEAVRRRDAIMAAQRRVAFDWLDRRIGGQEKVLVDSHAGDGWLAARSMAEAPDADGIIYLKSRKTRPGDLVEACIRARESYDLIAEIPEKRGGKRRQRR